MPTVPDPILTKLRCIRCRRFLSHGPLILQPSGGTVCGRCHLYREGPRDQYRHFAFEALNCYFKFPCKNWSSYCPAVLPYKQIPEHERKCSYGSSCYLCCCHPFSCCRTKPKLNLKAAINLEIIPDQVLEYLRCGNCAGYLSNTPVLVCRDGTSVCHRCSSQIQESSEFIRDQAFEAIVDMMIFPCIYRYRGCTQYFKFGQQSWEHELDCPYGKPYVKKEKPRPEPKRQESVQRKERGVIQTHSGHIYATITPNAPLFIKPVNRGDKDMFSDEFQRYRENLAGKWGRPENVYGYPDERGSSMAPDILPRGNYQRTNYRNSFAADDDIPRPFHISGGNLSPSHEDWDEDRHAYGNTSQGGNDLIEELRIRQQLKKVQNQRNGNRDSRGSDYPVY